MIFHSGAKLRRFKYTVRPQSTVIVHGPQGPVTQVVKPLRAIFKYGNDHTFDSLAAQKEYGWSDTEREMVEQALQDPSNGYFGKFDERRIYLDTPQVIEESTEKCKGVNIVNGQPMPCENNAVAGGIYCDRHVLETVNAPRIAACPEPVEDGDDIRECGKPVMEGSEFCAEHTSSPEAIPEGASQEVVA